MTELQRDELLCVPKRRRLVHSKLKSSEGQDVLHVFYGELEIVFDEPDLLAFGDGLLQAQTFRAEDAMGWSIGAPYDWERVRELLESLLDHEILTRVSSAASPASARVFPATLADPAPQSEPRTFSAHDDHCPAITQEAFGHALDLGNLESLVPVYRVAHAALDQDGRQVGENNVSPRPLFLDLPTERRLCKYAGSRYQSDLPMNVSALRHMTKRWPELLSLTEQFRVALLARLPARGPALTVGDAHLLTVTCLASVGYVMVRGVGPVANGQLDGGLAAMFRLVDGVRLVTTELMRSTPGELGCEHTLDSQTVAAYAEQNLSYVGRHGVCAGPQALIDEYLRVLLDQQSAPIEATPSVAARLGDLDAAIDYGLHGQRVESLIRTYGAAQTLSLLQLRAALQQQAPHTRLHALLEQPIDAEHFPLLREIHPLRETLELEIAANRWLFARAAQALPKHARGELASTDDLFEFEPSARANNQRRLAEFLAQASVLRPCVSAEVAAVAVEVLALERSCLRAVQLEQQRLNQRLRRPDGRALIADDLVMYTRPRSGPSLGQTLAQALGLTIITDAAASVLSFNGHSVTLCD